MRSDDHEVSIQFEEEHSRGIRLTTTITITLSLDEALQLAEQIEYQACREKVI